MRRFVVVGGRAPAGPFSLDNLPGAGRVDVLCRCMVAAFCLSHDFRRDVVMELVLGGPPGGPRVVRLEGDCLRNLNPDERSAAGLLLAAVSCPPGEGVTRVSPGVSIREGGLESVLSDCGAVVELREDGEDLAGLGEAEGGEP
ncbi:MAG: tRNA (pseudouridine(54)-N(1))-methyltransferase TrmY, partial [Euryarchaeota archaeon]|nr:tRNA (pseudouridine(54)-N(1))-methyltransferase TrmY [Euryarchaeota archaeon]